MDVLGRPNRGLIGQLSLDDEDIALAPEKLADCLGLERTDLISFVDATKRLRALAC